MFPSYDVDKSGSVDKKEMAKVMKSIYAMTGSSERNAKKEKDLDEKVKLGQRVWT